MVLAFPEYMERKRDLPLGGHGRSASLSKACLIGTHIILVSTAALISMVGTFFGPVSIAIPVLTGSQLMLNVVAMGVVLRMRAFDKAQRVGTYVVFFSVLSLIDVGPGIQDNQDVLLLLGSTRARLWSLFVALTMVVSAIFTLPLTRDRDGGSETCVYRKHAFLTLTVGSAMSNVSMATIGKTLSLLTGSKFYLAAVLYIVTGLLGTLFSVISSMVCEQGVFTPLSAVALIVTNALTGIIIWEDWKTIHAWLGYICCCMLMSLGVYLLAEVDLLENFWQKRAASGVGLLLHTHENGATEEEELVPHGQVEVWSEALETTYLRLGEDEAYNEVQH